MEQTETKTHHGPKGNILLGVALDFKKDPLAFLRKTEQNYPHISRFRFAYLKMVLLSHPDYVKHVLQANNKNYIKGFQYKFLMHILGEGLLTSEGDFWLRQRRLAQPAFHRQQIAGFADMMVDSTQNMLEEWNQHPNGNQLDVFTEMMRLTLDIVAKTLFTATVEKDAGEIGEALTLLVEDAMGRIEALVSIPLWVPTPQNNKVNNKCKVLNKVLQEIIDHRRKSGVSHPDLLQMLMDARDEETNEQMNDDQLRDEAMTIFLAGHETTANALTWTFYLLSEHPEIEQKFHEEIEQVLSGRAPNMEDARELKYTLQIIKESMRLYPPAWVVGRTALGRDEVHGYEIRKGDNVMLSSWLTHRLPDFWEDPERFDPDRFTPEKEKAMHNYQYYPFGGGPRLCIGNNFALLEMQLVLATIGQKYRLKHVEGHEVVAEPLVTLRPANGMLMHLNRRASV